MKINGRSHPSNLKRCKQIMRVCISIKNVSHYLTLNSKQGTSLHVHFDWPLLLSETDTQSPLISQPTGFVFTLLSKTRASYAYKIKSKNMVLAASSILFTSVSSSSKVPLFPPRFFFLRTAVLLFCPL